MFAERAAFSTALEAAYIDLNARLREREVARTETCLNFASEDRLYELVQHTLKVAECDLLIHNKTFHLMEHRGVGRVTVGTEYTSRCQHLDRRLLRVHDTDLSRACVGTEQDIFRYIEGILHISCRMVLCNV